MTDTRPTSSADTVHDHVREHLISEALHELRTCCPNAETVLLAIAGPTDNQRVEFLGPKDPDDTHITFGWINADDEQAYNRATELIVGALSISLPPYLRPVDDPSGATHEIAIADTAYGKNHHR